MSRTDSGTAWWSALDRLVAAARTRPEAWLGWILGVHLIVWTVLPWLVCPNLQLDLVEDLALGKEWQLGYWKHPPLPWLLADALYRVTGDVRSVYLLGPLAAVACLYAVWLLARDVVGPWRALVAVLVLEGLHYYNFSVVKFAHDQMQLPFWALSGLFFHRGLTRARPLDWALAGACLALAFWSKYAAVALAATLGIFLLVDPTARKTWRTSGPYVMAVSFAVVIAPNVWQLIHDGFLPFRYVDGRAVSATHWYQYVIFPLRWAGGQLLFALPSIMLLVLLCWPDKKSPAIAAAEVGFDRRVITALAVGPFVVTTVISLILGRLPVAMWGYPLWSFAPLALLMWLPQIETAKRLRLFAAAFALIFVGWPVIYAGDELLEPLIRDRPKASQFPGQLLADTVTRIWRDEFHTPLRYVGGADTASGGLGEFPANTVAVYSTDRPHVIVHGDLNISPWINAADLKRHGAVLIWTGPTPGEPQASELKASFPTLQPRPPIAVPRFAWHPGLPIYFGYALVPPEPAGATR